MKNAFQIELAPRIAAVFLFCGGLIVDVCAADQVPSAQTQSLLASASSNLAAARSSQSDPQKAVGYYLTAADTAVRAADSSDGGNTAGAESIYNDACAEVTILLRSSTGQLWQKTQTIAAPQTNYRLQILPGSRKSGVWDPGYFGFFRTRKQLRKKILGPEPRASDWGGVLVGVYKPLDTGKLFIPPTGQAIAVTAVLNFAPSSVPGTRDATLALDDPSRLTVVRIGGFVRPLGADFGAPLAYYPSGGLKGLYAMLRPGDYAKFTGLYMLEPYDPDQIPVVLVHGLQSLPQMWIPTIDAIEDDPQLRGKFQFWVFAYPTGNPIALSALSFRESLDRVYKQFPKTKNMVLIAHSLGGLLSQMQSVNTERVLWDRVFGKDADETYNQVPDDNVLKRGLIFDANPRIDRIVFICVPHRGSDLAINWIGKIGISLIRLPLQLSGLSNSDSAIVTRTLGIKRLPTGINGLSPRSPVLLALNTLPIKPPYYSIIGDRGRGDTPNSSDGVVAYWSSHLAGAQSELIVPGDHGSFALPQTTAELKRILRLELVAVGAARQKSPLESQRRIDRPQKRIAQAQTDSELVVWQPGGRSTDQ